ncbi:glycosyltransferase [Candidatus Woesearchaeota archaeon]|nr:glycosyltransferase [Candidatus Woesearchaeota archaeon]
MTEKTELSIVIPAYNEQDNVIPLYGELKKVLESLGKSFEIIFVDDGSTDRTLQNIKELHEKDERVKALSFSKNFQKAAALSAGFDNAKGRVIITMDADLQDDSNEIPGFLAKLEQGYDLVVGWKHKRKDSFAKKIPSRIFNLLIRLFTGTRVHDCDCNFRAIREEAVKDLNIYGGLYRYIPVLVKNKGHKVGEIKVNHRPRKHGKSKYGFNRLFKGAFDLVTIKFLTSYNNRPLHLFGGLGAMMSLAGIAIGAYLSVIRLYYGEPIGGRPLLLLGVLLILMGTQLISMGLIGEMIANTYQRTEHKYVIRERLE